MVRSIRIEFPEAFYHVLARGSRREAIFRDDEDRGYFLKVLSEACARTGWRIHSLAACGLGKKELKGLPGSDLGKVEIACRIRGNSTVSISWISEKLSMKCAANASQQIRRMRAGKKDLRIQETLHELQKTASVLFQR